MTSERGAQTLGAGLATASLVALVVLDIVTAGRSFVLASLFALSTSCLSGF